jgi:transcriptional regulator with XRE-family HTH domain
MSRQYLWQIERGEPHGISAEKLERIAEALGWPDFKTLYESDSVVPPKPAPASPTGGGLTEEDVTRIFDERMARLREIERGERVPVVAGPGEGAGAIIQFRRPQAADERPARTIPLFEHGAMADRADDVDFLSQASEELELPVEIAAQFPEDAPLMGVAVEGNSLSGLDLYNGMVVIGQQVPVTESARGRGYKSGDVVIALAWSGDETPKYYVKQYRSGTQYPDGLWSVIGDYDESGRKRTRDIHHEWEYRVVARVVGAFRPFFMVGRSAR